MGFERSGGDEVYAGQIFSVRKDQFRHDDGEEVTREVVEHGGAVAVIAYDDEGLYLVSQPREAAGEAELLELPAGKLDGDPTLGEDEEETEDVLTTARRELAEEIGKGAENWRHLTTFFTSPGFTNEKCHLYLATDLKEASAESEEDERITVKQIGFDELDDVIERCRDAKTLVGLLWFRAYERESDDRGSRRRASEDDED